MTLQYTNWQYAPDRSKFAIGASPNLKALLDYLRTRWGGLNLGIGGSKATVRNVRGGTADSSHNYGAALDWRYSDSPGREKILSEVLPFLIQHHEILGIQLIVDYIGSRAWNATRHGDAFGGWKPLKASSTGMGQSWAQWLHIETNSGSWGNSKPVADRFPPPADFPPFAPDFGLFGLWPIVPKPTIQGGAAGDIVRYLQGVLRKAGGGLPVDGRFGIITRDHVAYYQMENGIPGTGVVDAATWAKLDALAGRQ
jgi:hypothetical protein